MSRDQDLSSVLSLFKNNAVSKINSFLVGGGHDLSNMQVESGITRNQLILKICSTVVGVGASFTITYFAIKWMTDAMDPTKKEKRQAHIEAQKMLLRLGVKEVGKLSDYELCVAANLIDPRSIEITWSHIGGLENIIDDIQQSVILPFTRSNLYKNSSLLQPPKGILLYGPPGCGKTMIAKATAKAAGARFINLQVSTLVDKWYGESQKRTEAVFSLASKLQPAIIFIDEIDSFLRSRSSTDHEATAMMKTQFMSLWDGMTSDPNCNVMIMGATNRRTDVDAAILRRMPSQFYIGMPDADQRKSIFMLILRKEKLSDDMNFDQLSQLADGLSGSDLREACRLAAVAVLNEHIQDHPHGDSEESNDSLRAMRMADLQNGIFKMKQSKNLHQAPPID